MLEHLALRDRRILRHTDRTRDAPDHRLEDQTLPRQLRDLVQRVERVPQMVEDPHEEHIVETRAEEIDVDRAEQARQRAESRRSEGGRRSMEDMYRAEAAMRRSMVRLKIGRRQRGRQAAQSNQPGGTG